MRCHAPLIPQYMESIKYKGKVLGKNEQGIKELPAKMFESNKENNDIGSKKASQKNLVSYISDEE